MTLSDYPPYERGDEWRERIDNFWERAIERAKLVAEGIMSRQLSPITIVMKTTEDSPGVN